MSKPVFMVWKDGAEVEDVPTFMGVFSTASKAFRFVNLNCEGSPRDYHVSQESINHWNASGKPEGM